MPTIRKNPNTPESVRDFTERKMRQLLDPAHPTAGFLTPGRVNQILSMQKDHTTADRMRAYGEVIGYGEYNENMWSEITNRIGSMKSPVGLVVSNDPLRQADIEDYIILNAYLRNHRVIQCSLWNDIIIHPWTSFNRPQVRAMAGEEIQEPTPEPQSGFSLGEQIEEMHNNDGPEKYLRELDRVIKQSVEMHGQIVGAEIEDEENRRASDNSPKMNLDKPITWVIIKGITTASDGERWNTDTLGFMLNDHCFDKAWFESKINVVVLTPSITPFKGLSDKCWTYSPDISTAFERAYILTSTFQDEPIFNRMLAKNIPMPTLNEMIDMIENTAGLNLNQLQSILAETIVRKVSGEKIELSEIMDRKKFLIDNVMGLSTLTQAEMDMHGFDQIGGYSGLIEFMREKIINLFDHREEALALDCQIPKGMIMFGPPGTGKTLFAKSLAHEMGMFFLEMDWGSFKNKYVGNSEENLRKALAMIDAMGSRCIVFIDEIDGLGKRSKDSNASTSGDINEQLFNIMLKWLGEKKRQAFVVGTTNLLQKMDDAFIRPGRIDYLVYCDYPDQKAREDIFRVHLKIKGKPKNIFEVDRKDQYDTFMAQYGAKTEWLSGAEIEAICKNARTRRFNQNLNAKKAGKPIEKCIMHEDVMWAINDFIPEKDRKHNRDILLGEAKEKIRSQEILEIFGLDKEFDSNGEKRSLPKPPASIGKGRYS